MYWLQAKKASKWSTNDIKSVLDRQLDNMKKNTTPKCLNQCLLCFLDNNLLVFSNTATNKLWYFKLENCAALEKRKLLPTACANNIRIDLVLGILKNFLYLCTVNYHIPLWLNASYWTSNKPQKTSLVFLLVNTIKASND